MSRDKGRPFEPVHDEAIVGFIKPARRLPCIPLSYWEDKRMLMHLQYFIMWFRPADQIFLPLKLHFSRRCH